MYFGIISRCKRLAPISTRVAHGYSGDGTGGKGGNLIKLLVGHPTSRIQYAHDEVKHVNLDRQRLVTNDAYPVLLST